MRFHIKAFALTCGIFWGLSVFVMTWWLILFNADVTVMLLSEFYRGFTVSPLGSLVGLAWAFFDGLVGGAIFAWIYNKLAAFLMD